MEVLQNHVNSAEEPSQATNWKFTPHKHVEHRFKGIPKLSSAILSRQPPLKAEPVTSDSSDSTSKTSAERKSAASTTVTSVLWPAQVFTIQKFHVSPSMPVDEKIQAVWTLSIKSRLSAVLLHDIPTGTCVQELMMAGKRQVNLRPTIVVSCNDAATKRKVEKTFKGQCWLQDLLKTHHMMFVALVAETLFSAGPVLSGGSLVTFGESYRVAQMPSWSTTSCGLSLLTSCDGHSLQRSTLGGLLAVDGTIVGLTAGHPFDRTNRSSATERSAQGDPAADNASSEISSMTSSEPFIFNGDEEDDADGEDVNNDSVMTTPLQNANGYLDSDIHTPYQPAEASILREPLGWHSPEATMLPVSGVGDDECDDGSQNVRDWALLLGLPLALISQHNKVAHEDPRDDYQITVTSSGPAAGEVVIATASIGPQIGQLHSAPAAMKVDQLVLNVQLITLEHVLPRGSSGAWVILEEKLCGYVVAIRQDLPWAYMVAIEPVIEDIKRTLKTGNVRLPTAREIELAAQAYSNDPSYLSPSEADKQSQLKDKDWPSASTVQGCDRLDWRPELKSTSEMQGGPELPSDEDVKDIPKGAEGNSTKVLSERPNQHGPAELSAYKDSILPDNLGIPALDEPRCRRPQEAKDSRHKRQGFVKPEQARSERDSSQAAATVPIKLSDSDPSSTLVPSTLPSSNCSPESMTELPDPQEISIGQVRGTRKGKLSDSSNLVSFTLPSSNNFLPYPSEHSKYISERDAEKTSPNSRGFVNGPWGNEETISPFNIWWRFEAFVLRLEYRRWKYAPYGGLYSFWGLLLNPLRSPGRTPLWIALSTCVTFLYFLCFFPFICWVWKRYGDVLATDSSKADPLNSRRRRAIRMLGTLPNQYRDAELVKERERLLDDRCAF